MLVLSAIKEKSLIITDWSGVISDDRRLVYETIMRLIERHGVSRITFEEWLPRTQVSAQEFLASMGLKEDGDLLFEEYRAILTKVVHRAVLCNIGRSYVTVPCNMILVAVYYLYAHSRTGGARVEKTRNHRACAGVREIF